MRIRFSPESVQDLKRLHDFLAKHDVETASTTVLNLKAAINRFIEMPRIGRPLEDIENVREFVFGRYVVRYLVKDESVYILRLWHSKESR
ncbi:Plasmid stabilization system [Pseudodesulfovibrio profundus]|uniref:Plasmid stabilization system n=1 Tax=Pseudodesulfovibrio profundus TaxID=57320 RepID=A0A2C8F6H9_9BACT|nr:type II toxin-antitoxin system RelE/ParE family toxin [Pseudodesulfovibrio profundus]SOB58157.1 Plasmid stabilization system [Pseudodesulfovibrio profundus]